MRLVIPYVALWMILSTIVVVYSASVKDTERTIVKRDVAEVIPSVFAGAVDMTLDLVDRFGKGFAVRGTSKTDAFGLHDEKNFEAGTGDAMVPQERTKRSATSPDTKILARRKRSAQSIPCDDFDGFNRQPFGTATNNFPQQQPFPQQQQQPFPQQQQQPFPQLQQQQIPRAPVNQPAGGVNIGDFQRAQGLRKRRNVDDPDRVIPTSNAGDKNLFERIVEVAKDVVTRVTRWSDNMDKEKLAVDQKSTPDKPKL